MQRAYDAIRTIIVVRNATYTKPKFRLVLQEGHVTIWGGDALERIVLIGGALDAAQYDKRGITVKITTNPAAGFTALDFNQ